VHKQAEEDYHPPVSRLWGTQRTLVHKNKAQPFREMHRKNQPFLPPIIGVQGPTLKGFMNITLKLNTESDLQCQQIYQ
jgi:hypothetical protein